MPRSSVRGADDPATTRHRLLEAAGEVFAQHGYRAGTVREICARAGANLAAVNYHFGDKEGLYRALLTHAYEASLARHPPDLGVRPGDPPARRLHAFVRSFLLRLLDEGRAAWHARLMCRELNEPSPVLAEAVRGSLKRVHDLLKEILRDVAAEVSDVDGQPPACAASTGLGPPEAPASAVDEVAREGDDPPATVPSSRRDDADGERRAPGGLVAGCGDGRSSFARRPALTEDQLTRCAMSVAGQCLHYRLARPILDALYAGRFGREEVDALAEHITAFTLGGVRAVVQQRQAPRAGGESGQASDLEHGAIA